MNRLTPQNRYLVSNRAALLAALILVFTSYFGLNADHVAEQVFAQQNIVSSTTADTSAAGNTSKKHKLSISLLLFGRG